jgi:Protein of unknown function (DUF2442)
MLQPRVTGVRVESSFRVRMQFSDGTEGVADLASWIVGRKGVFLPLQDTAYFALVRVDKAAGTLVWPNGVDLDPDMLYDAAHASS